MKKDIIKEYLKNKDVCREMLRQNIAELKKDIAIQSRDHLFDISDFVLPQKEIIQPEKNNHISDITSMTVIRFEEIKESFLHEQKRLLDDKVRYLYYLTDLKQIYDNIDFQILKLPPREKRSIEIYSDGGKISQIASELNCSYNTARNMLSSSFKTIEKNLNSELLGRVAEDYIEYII